MKIHRNKFKNGAESVFFEGFEELPFCIDETKQEFDKLNEAEIEEMYDTWFNDLLFGERFTLDVPNEE